jgi:hypothetical protein
VQSSTSAHSAPGGRSDLRRKPFEKPLGMAWLVAVAALLGVSVILTEKEPERKGPTDPRVAARLSTGKHVLRKPSFGLAATPEISAARVARLGDAMGQQKVNKGVPEHPNRPETILAQPQAPASIPEPQRAHGLHF